MKLYEQKIICSVFYFKTIQQAEDAVQEHVYYSYKTLEKLH